MLGMKCIKSEVVPSLNFVMVVERGHGDEKKSGADSYADQIFGDGLFEGNTWTHKPTRIPSES